MARGTKEVEPINYYPINEAAARRAKEMNSFYDYVPPLKVLFILFSKPARRMEVRMRIG